jgi:hypothetical protein
MNKDMPEGPKVEFVDNPYAPDLFADGATGWYFLNGNVRVTLEAVRVGHAMAPSGPVRRVVVARLVMPIEAIEAMAKGLLEFAEQQRKQAAAPSDGSATIQ